MAGLQVFLKDGVGRLTAEVENADGDLADPTGLVFTVKDPSGNSDTYTWPGTEVDQTDTGIFEAAFDLDERGRWGAHVRSENPTAVAEEWFRVEESHVVA